MKTPLEVVEVINNARYRHIPRDRAGIQPFARMATYRGKRQWIVGYSWHKLYAHHASGRVYDCILGYGHSLEDAIEKAKARIDNG